MQFNAFRQPVTQKKNWKLGDLNFFKSLLNHCYLLKRIGQSIERIIRKLNTDYRILDCIWIHG